MRMSFFRGKPSRRFRFLAVRVIFTLFIFGQREYFGGFTLSLYYIYAAPSGLSLAITKKALRHRQGFYAICIKSKIKRPKQQSKSRFMNIPKYFDADLVFADGCGGGFVVGFVELLLVVGKSKALVNIMLGLLKFG